MLVRHGDEPLILLFSMVFAPLGAPSLFALLGASSLFALLGAPSLLSAFFRASSASPAAPRGVAVSTTDLQARIDQWINFKSAATAEPGAKAAALHARPELGVESVAPRNETEQTIAGIWQELLGIEPIGVHDNFFRLGGQSLLATEVVARVRTALKTDLPLRRFFEEPTVAELAHAILPEKNGQSSAKPQESAAIASV